MDQWVTIAEIFRSPDINIAGKTVHRIAVRAVIRRTQRLLMIYSEAVGDYKFPGGGVDGGESHEQALAREVSEECGMDLSKIHSKIGMTVEYDHPIESGFDAFKMTSHYYLCEIGDKLSSQKLEDYERDLGFKPVWVGIDEALEVNQTVDKRFEKPAWVKREIKVLEYLKTI